MNLLRKDSGYEIPRIPKTSDVEFVIFVDSFYSFLPPSVYLQGALEGGKSDRSLGWHPLLQSHFFVGFLVGEDKHSVSNQS